MTSYKNNASRRSEGKEPSPQEINMLVALFKQGHYTEIETRAREMTVRFPQHSFGWKAMGTALLQQGRNAEALVSLQKAAKLSQGDAQLHNNLGNTLTKLDRLSEAEVSYRQALKLNPGFFEAHHNLGNTLLKLGRLSEAEASYRRALGLKPDCAEAHCNLGDALNGQNRFSEAKASYRRAMELKPDFAEAHYNFGNTQKCLGLLGDAVASYRRALEIKPDFAEAYNNLGAALRNLGQLDDAVACYRRALEIKPDFAEAYNNLGNALNRVGQFNDAVVCCRRALEINSDYAEAHHNFGIALQNCGQIDAAVACHRRALQIKPDFANVYDDLLFVYNFLPNQSPAVMLTEARRYGELVARQARPHKAWSNVPEPARCLRVGLVSGDLRAHPVGYFLESVLTALTVHAAGRLEFFAYFNYFCTDAVTERIKACCRGWHSALGLSDETLAQQIHDDGIDILIDLSGHTAHNRLPVFAWKLAPIQASWLGYWATTGVEAMDYLIADPWTLPETEEIYFTEKIWRLPETRLCFTPPDVDVAVAPLPVLANGYITFGCFNNLSKMNDDVVALWARVLASVPGSRLFLKAKQLNEAAVRQSVIERFAVHGIGSDRMILEGAEPRAKYLTAYQRVDIALDPFPYTGGTTSAEGLWMGVPVLTLAGERFLSRQGIGLLMNAGLPEWIAADTNDYVALAVSYTGDLQRLATLRKGLRQQVLTSPIFDAPRFARHFEAALRGMWTQWCDQQQEKPL